MEQPVMLAKNIQIYDMATKSYREFTINGGRIDELTNKPKTHLFDDTRRIPILAAIKTLETELLKIQPNELE
jgi:hypothetical protein